MPGGTVYVFVDRSEISRDAPNELIEAKDETVRILQEQLEAEREARRRADTIPEILGKLDFL